MDGAQFHTQFKLGLKLWRLLPVWMQAEYRPERYIHLGPRGVFRWRQEVEDAFYAGC